MIAGKEESHVARGLGRGPAHGSIRLLEARMKAALPGVEEAPYVRSIPKLGPLTAAIFLGSIGSPQAYGSSKEILKVAGLSLVERSSGTAVAEADLETRAPLTPAGGLPVALRSIKRDGIFRAKFERLVAHNGRKKIPAVVALSRTAFRVARERRVDGCGATRDRAEDVAQVRRRNDLAAWSRVV